MHTLAPPAPPEDLEAAAAQDADGRGHLRHVMPTLPVFLDDELQHIDGLQADATDLRPGGTRILTKARAHIVATEATINTFWPPVIED